MNFEEMAEEFITFIPDEIAESGNGALMIGALPGKEPLGDNQPWELLTLRPDPGLAERCGNELRRRLVKLLTAAATVPAGHVREGLVDMEVVTRRYVGTECTPGSPWTRMRLHDYRVATGVDPAEAAEAARGKP